MISKYDTIILNGKHAKTLERVLADPLSANIRWMDVEAMLVALDADVSEGRGSRVHVVLNGIRAAFHRPHPRKEIDRGALKSVRRFLKEARICRDDV